MSTKQPNERAEEPISSLGVFAILSGSIIFGIVLGTVLSAMRSRWLDARRRAERGGRGGGVWVEKDVEAVGEKDGTEDRQHGRVSAHMPRVSLCGSKERGSGGQRLSDEKARRISRPTRLLPAWQTYIVVRSPLLPSPATHRRFTIGASPRTTRSLDSPHPLGSPIIRPHPTRNAAGAHSDTTVADHTPGILASKADSPALSKSPQRRVVWLDQLSCRSTPSRASRTNSLPSQWRHEEAEPEGAIQTRQRLGSACQMWLAFEQQQPTTTAAAKG